VKRMCDVPRCDVEATEEVASGWMCVPHAVRWDKALERGEVFTVEEFVNAGPDAPEELVSEECHAKWLGRTS
jgi:hypothetical protein